MFFNFIALYGTMTFVIIYQKDRKQMLHVNTNRKKNCCNYCDDITPATYSDVFLPFAKYTVFLPSANVKYLL